MRTGSAFRRLAILAGLGLFCGLAGAASAPAQPSPVAVGTGVHLQHFTFGEASVAGVESLSLLSIPAGARLRPADDLTLEVGTRWARGELARPGGTTSTVEGFTDTNVTASYRIGEDVATISAIAAIPTGKSSYTAEELSVAGAVAADLLPFRVSSWGSGGGFGFRVSSARDLGAVGAAVSVGYFRSGEFDPVEGELVSYRPGDNLSVRAGLDAPVGSAGEIGLQVGFQHYAEDELGGTNLFRPGNRYEAIGTYSFALGSGSGFLYGGYHRREQGTHLQGLDPVPSEDLYLAGTGARLQLGSVLLRPSVDGRLLRRTDSPHDGWQLRAGARAEIPAGDLTVAPVLRGHLGNVTFRPGAESGFTGIEAGLNLRLGDVER